jgi:hypothetical protein
VSDPDHRIPLTPRGDSATRRNSSPQLGAYLDCGRPVIGMSGSSANPKRVVGIEPAIRWHSQRERRRRRSPQGGLLQVLWLAEGRLFMLLSGAVGREAFAE